MMYKWYVFVKSGDKWEADLGTDIKSDIKHYEALGKEAVIISAKELKACV